MEEIYVVLDSSWAYTYVYREFSFDYLVFTYSLDLTSTETFLSSLFILYKYIYLFTLRYSKVIHFVQ